VESLAEAWGTRFPVQGGKTVWARMPSMVPDPR
jgi:hypothetical protein